MAKAMMFLRRAIALSTVAVTALLCYQYVTMYLTGNRPENLSGGVYLSPVFSAENVAARLSALAPALAGYALLVIAGLILQVLCPAAEKLPSPRPVRYHGSRHAGILRVILLGLAIVFIILGVMNGGARDVLVKAINICTECIGLG